MAISLSGLKQTAARKKALKGLEGQAARSGKKEKKRKGWSNILGSGAGLALGYGLAGALGVASGGLLMPLILGASGSMAKKWTDEASKKLGFGGKDVEAKGEFGYGEESAGDINKLLAESRKTDWSVETLGQDIALSYLTAGVGGDLKGVGSGLKTGGKEGWKQALGTTAKEKGWEGAKSSIAENLLGFTSKIDSDAKDVTSSAWETLEGGDQYNPVTGEHLDVEDWSYQQGGQVPQMDQQQLMALLSLAQMQQEETTYSGTPLEEKQQPTISEYFESQGKTLGGNNTQSLSQILGK